MFTGIVTARGRIATVKRGPDRLKLSIRSPYPDLAPGDSVAVSGACLTVVEADAGCFAVETIEPAADQQPDSDAEGNTGSAEQGDFR